MSNITTPQQKLKITQNKLKTSKNLDLSQKIKIDLLSLRSRFGFIILIFIIAVALIVNYKHSPINAIFRAVSITAPLRQQQVTKQYTASGLASSSTILVKFKANVSSNTINSIHRQNGDSVKRVVPKLNVQEVTVPGNTTVGSLLKKYRANPNVAYAEPNPITQRFMIPNDPLFSQQWNLAKINAPAAWNVSQGGYGPIAVLDTGIDASQSDLSGEIMAGYNFVGNNTNTSDNNGHGTNVAGIIAASTNNNNGVASIGFHGTLMPVKVLNRYGTGTYAELADGIIYAADHGAKIINMSLGGSSSSQTLLSAINYAEQKGVIIVAAAGNNGNNAAVYPADYPGVIAVSATTPSDTLASFSSYGGDIFVSAPGVGIISTYNNGGYATMSGTSMAAPEVAGLIGLALAHNPISTASLLTDLEQSSTKIGPYAYNQNGWNQYFGYGLINAAKLIQLVGNAPTPASTTTSPQVSPNNSLLTPQATIPSLNSQTVHGQSTRQFSVILSGTIDSVNLPQNIVIVKINNISQNLKLANNNLINVYINSNSIIKLTGQNISIASLVAGQKINGSALWSNNQLYGVNLNVQNEGSLNSNQIVNSPAGVNNISSNQNNAHALNGRNHQP